MRFAALLKSQENPPSSFDDLRETGGRRQLNDHLAVIESPMEINFSAPDCSILHNYVYLCVKICIMRLRFNLIRTRRNTAHASGVF
jgi:hypothetical protein